VIVGFSQISWPVFRAALWWAVINLIGVPSLSTVFDEKYFDTHIRGVLEVSNAGSLSTLDSIEFTKSAACFDPKDRVNGILNMCTLHLKVIPDYSKTKEKVYEQFTRAQIAGSETPRYSQCIGKIDKDKNRSYVCEWRGSTLEDPRLGPLPPGWQICYKGGKR
jgi:hypothetical protein